MGYFEQAWVINVMKWHFFLQYWYVSVIVLIIFAIYFYYMNKN